MCVSPLDGPFDYFDSMAKLNGLNNLAIMDIDGCFSNSLEFPSLPFEQLHMRSLNTIKNFRLCKYDIAFKEMLNSLDEQQQT